MVLPFEVTTPQSAPKVIRYAESSIPTQHGRMQFLVFREVRNGRPEPYGEHVAVTYGADAIKSSEALVRVHSECLTSEVFGSLKCDCREQLDAAFERIVAHGSGVVVYLRQEGRGIGLGNKIRAYALQERGADTIEANHQLGFGTDERSYDVAAGILMDLGIAGVRLLTNNPGKIEGLEKGGIRVVERVPVQIQANLHSAGYLRVKRDFMGHLLDSREPPPDGGKNHG